MAKALPGFFIIGAGKCGTTSLWHYFQKHRHICMSSVKEPSFFSMPEQWGRGWLWYESLFEHATPGQILGEASNSYSANVTYPHTVKRIAKHASHAKFIYCVRHPMHRTESDWMERQKISNISFTDFLNTDELYRDKNRYLHTYELFVDQFGIENVHVVYFDRLKKDTTGVVNECLEFLGLEPLADSELGIVHRPSTVFIKPGRVFRVIKMFPCAESIASSFSPSLKMSIRAILGKEVVVERPQWVASDLEAFRNEWQDLTEQFLVELGEDVNLWQW